MKVTNTKPFFDDHDIKSILADIQQSLNTGMLTFGPNVEKFEREFAEYTKVKHAIATNSGTSALEIALRYFDVKNSEVIVPTNSFVASANAVVLSGGKPIFSDIKSETLCIDPADIVRKITPNTKGVMVVHLAGLIPPEIFEIREICEKHGLFLLEDAAHAHGSMIDEKKAGSIGDAGCFSFFPTKPMTTGEGGMITTNDDDLDEFAKIFRNHGKKDQLYTEIGNNYRMAEINAILGIHQLKRLDKYISKRNDIAKKYASSIHEINDIELIFVPTNVRHSFWKYPIILKNSNTVELKKIFLEKYDISLGTTYYPPIHLQPVYKIQYGNLEGTLPVSEDVLTRLVCLPMFVGLTEEMIDYVIDSLKKEIIL